MRKFFIFSTLVLTACSAASGQSMLESGAVIAGTAVGSAAGKAVSDGVNSRLKKTSKILDTASKTGAAPKTDDAKAAKPAPATPLLQVGAGVPKAEPNNVPPPPPRRVAAARPVKTRPVSVPMVMSAVLPVERPFSVNIDLAGIQNGMARDAVLALGNPSARITMYEDGHILEIYQYRNLTLASGTVRLRDGAVWAVEARP